MKGIGVLPAWLHSPKGECSSSGCLCLAESAWCFTELQQPAARLHLTHRLSWPSHMFHLGVKGCPSWFSLCQSYDTAGDGHDTAGDRLVTVMSVCYSSWRGSGRLWSLPGRPQQEAWVGVNHQEGLQQVGTPSLAITEM